jgi:hypothetical protein
MTTPLTTSWRKSVKNAHKNAIRDLIIHAVLQSVKDAATLSTTQRLDGYPTFKPRQVPEHVRRIKDWTDSYRFEAWTEFVDINADTATDVIQDIAEGRRHVDLDRTAYSYHPMNYSEIEYGTRTTM